MCYTNVDDDNDRFVDLTMCGKNIEFDFDTGARCYIVTKHSS